MTRAVFFAVYLPSPGKRYVLDDFFREIRRLMSDATLYLGIQYDSIPDTEAVIDEAAAGLAVIRGRVKEAMRIDSDASSFIAALELYHAAGAPHFDLCYFAHTKGITTGMDRLRELLIREAFGIDAVRIFRDPAVMSYAPFLTVTSVAEDIRKLSCLARFNPVLRYRPLQYYYVHTFFILRGTVLQRFIEGIDRNFFTTPVGSYSDRYLMERDFSHIVDMQGALPHYRYLHGNYSTGFVPPTPQEVAAKVELYRRENAL